ncbi:Interferon alpha-inducible protein 27-like protein 2A [Liparis tanakae]|uniref:Interferon alpha-inducible protein 27-like protein 2A n=1 Tax=Liparis tanakae TaxID=230148 RepID=A0A4Z2DYM4_9TELE|nr:Interferon alpha-inducible protein 27-like protein 2A [Liparis tanakae]
MKYKCWFWFSSCVSVSFLAIGGGAAVAVLGAPLVLGAVGFTTAGIAVGSYGAAMMSAAAAANGGAVAAGSTVAVLQAWGKHR